MEKAHSSLAIILGSSSLCLSPRLPTSSVWECKAHIPVHFVRQRATCSCLPASG